MREVDYFKDKISKNPVKLNYFLKEINEILSLTRCIEIGNNILVLFLASKKYIDFSLDNDKNLEIIDQDLVYEELVYKDKTNKTILYPYEFRLRIIENIEEIVGFYFETIDYKSSLPNDEKISVIRNMKKARYSYYEICQKLEITFYSLYLIKMKGLF